MVKKENLRNGQWLIHRTYAAGVAYTAARCYDEETADLLVKAIEEEEAKASPYNHTPTHVQVSLVIPVERKQTRRQSITDGAVVAKAKAKHGPSLTVQNPKRKKK